MYYTTIKCFSSTAMYTTHSNKQAQIWLEQISARTANWFPYSTWYYCVWSQFFMFHSIHYANANWFPLFFFLIPFDSYYSAVHSVHLTCIYCFIDFFFSLLVSRFLSPSFFASVFFFFFSLLDKCVLPFQTRRAFIHLYPCCFNGCGKSDEDTWRTNIKYQRTEYMRAKMKCWKCINRSCQ